MTIEQGSAWFGESYSVGEDTVGWPLHYEAMTGMPCLEGAEAPPTYDSCHRSAADGEADFAMHCYKVRCLKAAVPSLPAATSVLLLMIDAVTHAWRFSHVGALKQHNMTTADMRMSTTPYTGNA